MRFITDRKRAVGRGAGHGGTEHHWAMTVSSVALAFLIPVWVFMFAMALGGDRAEVLATFSRPFPAILTALVLFVGMRHFAKGTITLFEDYARGSTRKMLIIGSTSLSYAVIAVGLFALAKIAL